MLVFGANVAGGEDDRNVGADGEELPGHLETSDPRHGEVGDDGGEAIGIRAKFSDSSDGVDVACDVVTKPLEKARAQQDERLFVVDEEETFVVGGFVGRRQDV